MSNRINPSLAGRPLPPIPPMKSNPNREGRPLPPIPPKRTDSLVPPPLPPRSEKAPPLPPRNTPANKEMQVAKSHNGRNWMIIGGTSLGVGVTLVAAIAATVAALVIFAPASAGIALIVVGSVLIAGSGATALSGIGLLAYGAHLHHKEKQQAKEPPLIPLSNSPIPPTFNFPPPYFPPIFDFPPPSFPPKPYERTDSLIAPPLPPRPEKKPQDNSSDTIVTIPKKTNYPDNALGKALEERRKTVAGENMDDESDEDDNNYENSSTTLLGSNNITPILQAANNAHDQPVGDQLELIYRSMQSKGDQTEIALKRLQDNRNGKPNTAVILSSDVKDCADDSEWDD